MGNNPSNDHQNPHHHHHQQHRGGSGKEPKLKAKRKEQRSCSDQLEPTSVAQLQQRNCCGCCCNHHSHRHGRQPSGSAKLMMRVPRRLAKKASEGAHQCLLGTGTAICVPRMAEDTVAMSRMTVASATVEERVAVAALSTAVRWQDLNGASLSAAGAVLSAFGGGGGVPEAKQQQRPQRRGGSDHQRQQQRQQRRGAAGGGSTRSTRGDRTLPSHCWSASTAADRPDLAACGFGDNASLDDAESSPTSPAAATLGAGLAASHQRRGAAFDGRRAKSFRYPAGHALRVPNAAGGPAPVGARARASAELGAPCPVTGLTLSQKRLILARWRQLCWPDMLRLAEQIFERTFRRNESFVRPVLRVASAPGGTMSGPHWRHQPAFRAHTLRFCHALAQLCAGLEEEPALGAELLTELGAQHAVDNGPSSSAGSVPDSYWDVLLLAMCEAAGTDGQQSQNTECFAPAGCSISSPSPASSSGISSGSSFSAPPPPPPPPLLPQWTRRAADAWSQLAVFVSAQLRHGYEMERFLRERMRKCVQGKERNRVRRRSLSANGSLTARAPMETADPYPEKTTSSDSGKRVPDSSELSESGKSSLHASIPEEQQASSPEKTNPHQEAQDNDSGQEKQQSVSGHQHELTNSNENPEEHTLESGKRTPERQQAPESGNSTAEQQQPSESGKPLPEPQHASESGKPTPEQQQASESGEPILDRQKSSESGKCAPELQMTEPGTPLPEPQQASESEKSIPESESGKPVLADEMVVEDPPPEVHQQAPEERRMSEKTPEQVPVME